MISNRYAKTFAIICIGAVLLSSRAHARNLDYLMPRPIGLSELQLYGDWLDLSPMQRHVWTESHYEYQQSFALIRDELLRIYGVDSITPRPTTTILKSQLLLNDRLRREIRRAENSFFAVVADMLSEDQLSRLELIRNARLSTLLSNDGLLVPWLQADTKVNVFAIVAWAGLSFDEHKDIEKTLRQYVTTRLRLLEKAHRTAIELLKELQDSPNPDSDDIKYVKQSSQITENLYRIAQVDDQFILTIGRLLKDDATDRIYWQYASDIGGGSVLRWQRNMRLVNRLAMRSDTPEDQRAELKRIADRYRHARVKQTLVIRNAWRIRRMADSVYIGELSLTNSLPNDAMNAGDAADIVVSPNDVLLTMDDRILEDVSKIVGVEKMQAIRDQMFANVRPVSSIQLHTRAAWTTAGSNIVTGSSMTFLNALLVEPITQAEFEQYLNIVSADDHQRDLLRLLYGDYQTDAIRIYNWHRREISRLTIRLGVSARSRQGMSYSTSYSQNTDVERGFRLAETQRNDMYRMDGELFATMKDAVLDKAHAESMELVTLVRMLYRNAQRLAVHPVANFREYFDPRIISHADRINIYEIVLSACHAGSGINDSLHILRENQDDIKRLIPQVEQAIFVAWKANALSLRARQGIQGGHVDRTGPIWQKALRDEESLGGEARGLVRQLAIEMESIVTELETGMREHECQSLLRRYERLAYPSSVLNVDLIESAFAQLLDSDEWTGDERDRIILLFAEFKENAAKRSHAIANILRKKLSFDAKAVDRQKVKLLSETTRLYELCEMTVSRIYNILRTHESDLPSLKIRLKRELEI